MKRRKILPFILLLTFLNKLNAENDYITFLNLALLKEFNQNFLLKTDLEYDRYADSKTNYIHNEIGFIYKINPKHFSTYFDYRIIKTKNPKKSETQQRIYFDICLKKKFKEKIFLNDKIGFEFRHKQKKPDILFLKNKASIYYEISSKKDSYIRPYVSDTIYYDINKRYAHINRFYIGIISNHNKNLFLDFQYYLESNIKKFSTSSDYSHNLGLQIIFYIPEKKLKIDKPFFDLTK